jgi:hypothetical protein
VPIDFAIGCPSEAGDPDLVPLLEAPNVQIEAARMLPPSRLRDFVAGRRVERGDLPERADHGLWHGFRVASRAAPPDRPGLQ